MNSAAVRVKSNGGIPRDDIRLVAFPTNGTRNGYRRFGKLRDDGFVRIPFPQVCRSRWLQRPGKVPPQDMLEVEGSITLDTEQQLTAENAVEFLLNPGLPRSDGSREAE